MINQDQDKGQDVSSQTALPKVPDQVSKPQLGELIVQKVNLKQKDQCYKNLVHNAYASQRRDQVQNHALQRLRDEKAANPDLMNCSSSRMVSNNIFKNNSLKDCKRESKEKKTECNSTQLLSLMNQTSKAAEVELMSDANATFMNISETI